MGFSIRSYPRAHIKEADPLAKAAAEGNPLPPQVFFETLKHSSTNIEDTLVKIFSAISSENWRATIMAFLRGHFVLEDEKEEKLMALCTRNYTILNDDLYRRGVCAPLLKCISREQGQRLLNEIHSGMCSSHIGTRALVGKAFKEGFY